MLARLGLVMLGGAAGTAARHGVALWSAATFGGTLPYGTLIVNVTGCLLIGALARAGAAKRISPNVLLALTTGFMGGFTTYSAYAWETVHAASDGALTTALAYVVATIAMCLGAGVLGHVIAERFVSAKP